MVSNQSDIVKLLLIYIALGVAINIFASKLIAPERGKFVDLSAMD